MIGDKLVITDFHRKNGIRIEQATSESIRRAGRIYTITVAGESGSGKSETAATSAEQLELAGFRVVILGQDDYFQLPPKSNAQRRKLDIGWVGPSEVRLDLLDSHLAAAKRGDSSIIKPLILFEEDRIVEEMLGLEDIDVVIAEGTYTTLLEEADFRAFIDRSYHDTLWHRKKRARDPAEGKFIERVLEIEHRIISSHRSRADLVLSESD